MACPLDSSYANAVEVINTLLLLCCCCTVASASCVKVAWRAVQHKPKAFSMAG